ncbi:MAG: peptide deformylase [Planctomycetia bacterium]|nr:peptide deformylase [Planctomycetia bacterium]
MTVLKYPHPVLKMTCRPLRKVDAELRKTIGEMFALMYETKGVGLAANQVGLPYRFFIMNPTGDSDKPEGERVFINPEIRLGNGKPILDEEGCLSFPTIYAKALRAPKVVVQAYNLKGEPIAEEYKGFAARIIQHEFDHLNGVAFVDRLDEDAFDNVVDDLDHLTQSFEKARQNGDIPSDAEIQKEIDALLKLRAVL